MTTDELDYLIGLAAAGVVDAAAQVQRHRALPNSRAHKDALTSMHTASSVLTQLRAMAASDEAPERIAGPLDGFDGGVIAAAAEMGVSIEKELGSIDPRANSPKCVHGVPFSVPCLDCSPDL